MQLFSSGQAFELGVAARVDCFGEEEEDEDGGEAAEGGLQPEDSAPRAEGDDLEDECYYHNPRFAPGGPAQRLTIPPINGPKAGPILTAALADPEDCPRGKRGDR